MAAIMTGSVAGIIVTVGHWPGCLFRHRPICSQLSKEDRAKDKRQTPRPLATSAQRKGESDPAYRAAKEKGGNFGGISILCFCKNSTILRRYALRSSPPPALVHKGRNYCVNTEFRPSCMYGIVQQSSRTAGVFGGILNGIFSHEGKKKYRHGSHRYRHS